jgi:hypothetical protein
MHLRRWYLQAAQAVFVPLADPAVMLSQCPGCSKRQKPKKTTQIENLS